MKNIPKCCECENYLDNLFLSLRKYCKDDVIESFNFCSKKCFDKFKGDKKDIYKDFKLFSVNRCAGYYDCKQFGNLRLCCEYAKEISDPYFLFPNVSFKYRCEPSTITMVRAVNKQNQILKRFSRESNKQFRTNKIMTILIIIMTFMTTIATIMNLIFFLK